MLAQQAFGVGQPVRRQRLGSGAQARFLQRIFQLLAPGGVHRLDIAAAEIGVAQRLPGIGQFRLERQGMAQGGDGAWVFAAGGAHQSQLVPGHGGAGMGLGQRFQHCAGAAGIAAPPQRGRDDQLGARIGGRLAQHLAGDLFRRRRIAGKQRRRPRDPLAIIRAHPCSDMPAGRLARHGLRRQAPSYFAFLAAMNSISSSGPGPARAWTWNAARAGLLGCSLVPNSVSHTLFIAMKSALGSR